MKLIIDAYNVLHKWRSGPMPEGPRELNALAQMIERSRFNAATTDIVCDGATIPGCATTSKTIHFRFAGPGKDADTLIESMVLQHKGPTLHVVSSDRRVQKAARKRRGVAHTSDAFLATLVRDAGSRSVANPASRLPKPEFALNLPLHPVLINQWKNEFDIDWAAAGSPASNPLITQHNPQHKQKPKHPKTVQQAPAKTQPTPNPTPKPTPTPANSDPDLKEILEHYQSPINPEDLDMSKWLDH